MLEPAKTPHQNHVWHMVLAIQEDKSDVDLRGIYCLVENRKKEKIKGNKNPPPSQYTPRQKHTLHTHKISETLSKEEEEGETRRGEGRGSKKQGHL